MNYYRVWLAGFPTVTTEIVPAPSSLAARAVIARRDDLDITDLCSRRVPARRQPPQEDDTDE